MEDIEKWLINVFRNLNQYETLILRKVGNKATCQLITDMSLDAAIKPGDVLFSEMKILKETMEEAVKNENV